MSNSKGNAFPLWGINIDYQVFAVDTSGNVHSKSKRDFAYSVAVSEDGTVWALSIAPDPDGGGSKLFWSDGDGNWTEINTSDPGGVRVCGGQNDTCIYSTGNGDLRLLDTNTNNKLIYSNPSLVEFDYGGGILWGILPNKEGGIPTLHYSDSNNINWKEFAGSVSPYGLSANYEGNCAATFSFNPMVYSKDGSSSYSGGSGLEGKAMQATFKNWNFVLSIEANENGNLIYEWVDEQGGSFEQTNARASQIAASYHKNS